MSEVVGIDLGTTNSLVAYVTHGVPIVIRDRSGDAPKTAPFTSDAKRNAGCSPRRGAPRTL